MTLPPRAPTVALVPLRAPGAGKSRLAGELSPEGRAALAGAMLADVTTALADAPVDRVVVAADGPAAVAAASALGLESVADPPRVAGLDTALAAAAAQLGHVGTLLVVAADLPWLRPVEITAVLETDAEVVVAPTSDGGTGGLLRRPADACPTAYGVGSARRHLTLADAAGRSSAQVHLPGFAQDVDVAADLVRLTAPGGPPLGVRTRAVLERLEIAAAG